jgi:hypothetical protein
MPETAEALGAHLLALETALQSVEVRGSAARLGELLAPDFREFGRSGAAYSYSDILALLPAEASQEEMSISGFAITLLSETIALATYRGIRTIAGGSRLFTNRSSIWRQDPDGRWRMVFHQGTPTA